MPQENFALTETSISEWRTVFWVTFLIFVITTIIFCIWASGEIQEWNYPKGWKKTEDDRKNADDVTNAQNINQ